jgi:hypothetical protein
MAHVSADRVRDTSTSTGTGAFVVSGTAPTAFRTFSAVLSTSDTFYYAIQHQTASEWEVGLGTYSSANTITRTTVYASSAGGSAVTFSSGTKDVFITLAATRSVQLDNNGNVGIGTSTPFSKLSVAGGTLSVAGSTAGSGVVKLGDPTDPTPYVGMYRAAAAAIATSGNFLNLGGYDGIAFTTGQTQFSGQTERMRIDSSGNVGVGTASPTQKLTVSGSGVVSNTLTVGQSGIGDSVLQVYSSYAGLRIGYNSTNVNYYDADTQIFRNTAGTERMRIDSSGNLLVGTTSMLNSGNTMSVLLKTGNSTGTTWKSPDATGGAAPGYLNFFNSSGTQVGYIAASGTATTYATSSDYRLKENFVPMDSGLVTVNALKPVNFVWINEQLPGEGFIAHELQEVIPLAVTGAKDAVDADGNPVHQGVDYSKIVVHLVAAIQELSAKVAALEAK